MLYRQFMEAWRVEAQNVDGTGPQDELILPAQISLGMQCACHFFLLPEHHRVDEE